MMKYMKKKRVLLPFIGTIYFIALIALMPARVILALVPIPDQLSLGGVQGTVWAGTIARVRTNDLVLDGVEWRLDPIALVRMRVSADIRIPAGEGQLVSGTARITASSKKVAFEDVRLAGELETFIRYIAIDMPIPVRGQLTMSVAEFVLGQPVCEILQGNLFAMQVEARLLQGWEQLGDYDIGLACNQGRIEVVMLPENLLGLSVQGTIAQQGMELRIGIAPQAGAPRGIRDLIQWLGPADGQGRRYFNIRL